jgi:hypothetical protein
MKITWLSIALVIGGGVGCVASRGELRALSSGKTGCPPHEIAISNSQVGLKTASWTAKCRGKIYFCAGDDMLRGVTCTPAR